MSEKLTSRQIQAKNTKEKIYNVSIELVEEKGFDNVTVAEICEKADVSVGSFYNHFKTKYDILNEVFKLADDYFYYEVKEEVQGNSIEKIREYLNIYAGYNVDRGLDFMNQLYSGKNNLFAVKKRPMQLGLDEIVKEGQRNNELRDDMKSYDIVDYLYIAVRGVIYDWCLANGNYDLVEKVDAYVALMLKSVIKE